MTFYILRHGQKEEGEFYNPDLRHQDPPLSETGKNDAIELIHYFSKKEIKEPRRERTGYRPLKS